jgi:hypothetical protein
MLRIGHTCHQSLRIALQKLAAKPIDQFANRHCILPFD